MYMWSLLQRLIWECLREAPKLVHLASVGQLYGNILFAPAAPGKSDTYSELIFFFFERLKLLSFFLKDYNYFLFRETKNNIRIFKII